MNTVRGPGYDGVLPRPNPPVPNLSQFKNEYPKAAAYNQIRYRFDPLRYTCGSCGTRMNKVNRNLYCARCDHSDWQYGPGVWRVYP